MFVRVKDIYNIFLTIDLERLFKPLTARKPSVNFLTDTYFKMRKSS